MVQECASDADSDGDGMPNLLEYLADTGTCGEIRSSKSEVRSQRPEGGVAARQFLQQSQSVGAAGDNRVTLFTNNPPTPLQTSLFDLLGTNRALFYRVMAVRE
jgi:hypothetical protein